MKIAETILKALGEPVLLLDERLRYVMANPAFYRLLQVPPGPLEGKSLQEFISARSAALQLIKILEPLAAHDEEVDDVDVMYVLPDHTRILLSVSARLVPEKQGLPKMILVELRDVTQQRIADRKVLELNKTLEKHVACLEVINKELESFSHSVSHNLRTPLRLMNKVAHILLRDHRANLPDAAVEIVDMIIDSTREMEELIEVLLTFSQVIRDPLKRRRVDLQRLAREVIEELRDEWNGRAVEFVVEDLPPCSADHPLLKQVFLNLLSNALKFTRHREETEIRIGFTEASGETVYFVRDNGVGFDMDKSDSLFVAFHRLHKPGEFEGSGVGLALVRRIVERHNGRVWAESEMNKGATFYFTVGA